MSCFRFEDEESNDSHVDAELANMFLTDNVCFGAFEERKSMHASSDD